MKIYGRTGGAAKAEWVEFEPLGVAQRLLVIVFLAVMIWYLYWRLGTFNPHAFVLSASVYAVELWFAVNTVLHLFMIWRLSVRSPPEPLDAQVDVFVTTVNEPEDMVRRTLIGALDMELPHRTYLLDDGGRDSMRGLAADLGCGYLTRNERRDAKAGNINHALSHTCAPFVAVFDADHVPAPNFLMHTLGYFRDPAVAFVQCPQTFYNLDAYQMRGSGTKLWGEQALFFRVIQRGKDYYNATMFVGTNAVLRRRALERVGGIATGTVTEDFHTTLRLQRDGWRSIYHDEALAFGLAAPSLAMYLRQRLRWGQGAMQVWRREGLISSRRQTMAQRLCNLASVLTYFDAWPQLFLYALPSTVLVTGVVPLAAFNATFLMHFVPYYVLSFWVFEETARGFGHSYYTKQYNLLRAFVFALSTLALLRARPLHFRVSDKSGRAWRADIWILTPQLLELTWVLAGLVVGVVMWPEHPKLSAAAFFANVVWSVLALGVGGSALLFTFNHIRRRYNYRFPLPAPLRLDIDGKLVYAFASDLSSFGMRVVLPRNCPLSGVVAGELFLPGGVTRFQAEVKHGSVSMTCSAWGLRFLWPDDSPPHALERFLYQSDLQWRLNAFSENAHTPIVWLRNLLHRGSAEDKPTTASREKWRLLFDVDGSREQPLGLARPINHYGKWLALSISKLEPCRTLVIAEIDGEYCKASVVHNLSMQSSGAAGLHMLQLFHA